MPIGADFTINTVLKTIRHTAGLTVYEVNDLYVWLQSSFDDLAYMPYQIPIFAQTPTIYMMINGWFIDEESTKYLKIGAISSTDWTHPTNPTGIRLLQFDAVGYVNCIAGDIGLQVTGAVTGDTGTLLYYDNTTRKWWIRCDAVDDLFDQIEAVTIAAGIGAGTTTGASLSGEEVFANIYTIGTIEAGTDLYIMQNNSILTSWWPAGHIDVLIKIKEASVEIASGELTILARKWTDSFDYFEIDLSDGGRNPIPIATADDTYNPDPLATVANYNDIQVALVNCGFAFDTGAGTGLATGKLLWDETTDGIGVILAFTDAGATGDVILGNAIGVFANNDDLSILAELSFDNQIGLFTVGQVVTGAWSGETATIRFIIQDPEANGTVGKLYLSACSGPFQDNEPLSDPITGSADAFGTQIDAPTWDSKIDGASAIVHTTDKDLQNGDGVQPYDAIIDCNGRPLSEVYQYLKYLCREDSTNQIYRVVAGAITPTDGEQYKYVYSGYTPNKIAPFGQLSGTTFFGAQGIFIFNMDTDDINNYQLIDSNGVIRTPPNIQVIEVSGLAVNDLVCVFKLTGAGGTIDKNMCGGCDATPVGSNFLNVQGPIPSDTPSTGKVRIVDTSLGVEYVHTYSGISGLQFTGLAPVLAVNILNTDDLYIPYIDELSVGTSVSVTLIQTVVRFVLIRVRQYGILPFEVEGEFGTSGLTVVAIETSDTVVS